MARDPGLLTTSTNRNLFQPTRDNRSRRRTEIRQSIQKGKDRSVSGSQDRKGGIEARLTRNRSTSDSSRSGQSQLVDLVIEDTEAEEAERVRARKEGGEVWNTEEQKVFVRTYGSEGAVEGEETREGFEPGKVPAVEPPEFAVADDDEENDSGGGDGSEVKPSYGPLDEERKVWNSPRRHL